MAVREHDRRRADPRSILPRLSLAAAVYIFVVASAVAVLAGAALLFVARSDRLLDSALDSAVRLRSEAAAETYARLLHGDWLDLEQLAQDIPTTSRDGIRGLMDGIQGDGQRLSWVGYAGTDGTVLAASDGLLEGEDVSGRDWFRNGLRGGFAGDVHEALLLARRLPERQVDGPLRLLDLSRPVRDAEGDVTGVVGMHIDFGWAERALAETARTLGIDAFLLNANGDVIVASDGGRPSADALEILRTARSGAMTAGREAWPDGQDYFATLVPSVGYGDLPSFGWRLVGRIPADAFRPGMADLRGTAVVAGIGLVAILGMATAIFVLVFVRPIGALGEISDRIADGDIVYPPEYGGTREAARISGALARLQDRRVSDRRS
ncbi:hypothetical protein ROJ8625_03061 [Roseivivax jejudonensis]|uniref:HAMP domain-containing protein n=1 Tax=Roseivivax jejudonensis TaxID=1529041 RepID=A0A1X6ZSW4_9RHOB|nr:cache domain-containing protein [Roseivivax jejudonensis]SLN60357.1 hypothetical protein ROJ8625_03061 [Roseivivax jejudonensis]